MLDVVNKASMRFKQMVVVKLDFTKSVNRDIGAGLLAYKKGIDLNEKISKRGGNFYLWHTFCNSKHLFIFSIN